jgi:hypothetical protein
MHQNPRDSEARFVIAFLAIESDIYLTPLLHCDTGHGAFA